MKITAEQKYIRMSARKLRLVADGIRHMSPSKAVEQLKFINKRASEPVQKVLIQAIANATNNYRLSPQMLKIEHILVNEGPTFKRWQAVSRGRAHSILKRTSHVKVVLETKAMATSVAKLATDTTVTKTNKQETKKSVKTAKVESKMTTQQANTIRSAQNVSTKNVSTSSKPKVRQVRKGTK